MRDRKISKKEQRGMLRRRNVLKNVAFQILLDIRHEQSKPLLGNILLDLKGLKSDEEKAEKI